MRMPIELPSVVMFAMPRSHSIVTQHNVGSVEPLRFDTFQVLHPNEAIRDLCCYLIMVAVDEVEIPVHLMTGLSGNLGVDLEEYVSEFVNQIALLDDLIVVVDNGLVHVPNVLEHGARRSFGLDYPSLTARRHPLHGFGDTKGVPALRTSVLASNHHLVEQVLVPREPDHRDSPIYVCHRWLILRLASFGRETEIQLVFRLFKVDPGDFL